MTPASWLGLESVSVMQEAFSRIQLGGLMLMGSWRIHHTLQILVLYTNKQKASKLKPRVERCIFSREESSAQTQQQTLLHKTHLCHRASRSFRSNLFNRSQYVAVNTIQFCWLMGRFQTWLSYLLIHRPFTERWSHLCNMDTNSIAMNRDAAPRCNLQMHARHVVKSKSWQEPDWRLKWSKLCRTLAPEDVPEDNLLRHVNPMMLMEGQTWCMTYRFHIPCHSFMQLLPDIWKAQFCLTLIIKWSMSSFLHEMN